MPSPRRKGAGHLADGCQLRRKATPHSELRGWSRGGTDRRASAEAPEEPFEPQSAAPARGHLLQGDLDGRRGPGPGQEAGIAHGAEQAPGRGHDGAAGGLGRQRARLGGPDQAHEALKRKCAQGEGAAPGDEREEHRAHSGGQLGILPLPPFGKEGEGDTQWPRRSWASSNNQRRHCKRMLADVTVNRQRGPNGSPLHLENETEPSLNQWLAIA
mmetsp:Transcript_107293/g.346203  ORF Transcript_107293/g.346203 Transcript_107293/m.346203 type:complete len:214 (+) Transcript_107293:194-835(+)